MLGVPGSPGAVGWALLLAGLLLAAASAFYARSRLPREPVRTAAALSLVVTVGAVPFLVWRFGEDLRVTTKLNAYGATSAGPIQSFLPGYLVDGAQRLIPRDATFATAVSPTIPWQPARAAFPSLAMQTLFPRVSVGDPRAADFVVSWGVAPARVARVSKTWVVRPAAGQYPAVYVGKVRR